MSHGQLERGVRRQATCQLARLNGEKHNKRMQNARSFSDVQARGCPRLLLRLAAAAIAVAACGCATDGSRDPAGVPVTNVLAALAIGELRLNCGGWCAGYYGAFRKLQRARYDRQQWKDLAVDIARIGYGIDQSYFYLGRAAEGLGHVEAARTYYELALASRNKCG